MTYDLTLNNIAKSLARQKSNSCYDLLVYNGFTLRYVNSGKFRNVYQIDGTRFLIKVPITAGKMKVPSIAHARAEYTVYRRVIRSKKKYLALKSLIPDAMLFVPSTGVIVVEKYRKLGRVTRAERKRMGVIEDLSKRLFGGCGDLHDENFMRDAEGNLRIVDLGYLVNNTAFRDKLKKPKPVND